MELPEIASAWLRQPENKARGKGNLVLSSVPFPCLHSCSSLPPLHFRGISEFEGKKKGVAN